MQNRIKMRGTGSSVARARATVFALALALTSCGGGPQIQVTADYKPQTCVGQRVLLVPLAVSDDLGDQRTGVVLASDARSSASEAACSKLAQGWSKGTLICPPFDAEKKPSSLMDLEKAFALDAPVAPALWEALRGNFNADYALMFRPENVSSSNHVDRDAPSKDSPAARGAVVGAAALVSPGMLVGALIGAGANSDRKPEASTKSRTELNYTVSATLLDMRSGKVLKVGLNQGSAAQTVPRNLGYAEAPPVVPLLEKIMVPLGEEMLAD